MEKAGDIVDVVEEAFPHIDMGRRQHVGTDFAAIDIELVLRRRVDVNFRAADV